MDKVFVEKVRVVKKKDGSGAFCIVTINGKEMFCFDGDPRRFAGQDASVEITERNGRFYAKIFGDPIPHEGDVPPPTPDKASFKSGGGRPFGKSPEDLALTAKTMTASYAKDLVVAYAAGGVDGPTMEAMMDGFVAAYDVIYSKIQGTHHGFKHDDPPTGKQDIKEVPLPPTGTVIKTEGDPALRPVDNSKLLLPQEQPDEIVCGGKNAKLKGRKVKASFCKKCHFVADCDLRVEIPLE